MQIKMKDLSQIYGINGLNRYNYLKEGFTNPSKSNRYQKAHQNKQTLGGMNTPIIDNIDLESVIIDGIYSNDYPDFADAYIGYATYKDGTELSLDELNELNDDPDTLDFISSKIHEDQLWRE